MEMPRIRPKSPAISTPRTGKTPGPTPTAPRFVPPAWFQKVEDEILSRATSLANRAKSFAEEFGKALSQADKNQFHPEDSLLDRLLHLWIPSLGELKNPSGMEQGLKELASSCGGNTRVECPPAP